MVSSSFGQCELDFTAAYNNGTDFTSIPKTFHALFQQGNAQGITFLASSGDNGAPDCVSEEFANAPGVIDGTNFVPASRIRRATRISRPWAAPTCRRRQRRLRTMSPASSENADFDPRLPACLPSTV